MAFLPTLFSNNGFQDVGLNDAVQVDLHELKFHCHMNKGSVKKRNVTSLSPNMLVIL